MIPIRGLRAPVAPVSAPPRPHVPRKRPNPWNDARDAQLTRLWQAGAPTKEIAALLGGEITGHAVIGRAGRLGLGPHPVFARRSNG